MTIELRKLLIDVAAKRTAAELVIKNAFVVDVFNAEIKQADVAISGGYIAAIGHYSGPKEFDATGRYLVPGFIDSHVHIESSLLGPASFAALVLQHGTTTVIADPHEICNVGGLAAFDYMVSSSENLPLSIFYMIPSCVPATSFEHSGSVLDVAAIESRMDHKRVLGLGEMMDIEATVAADETILRKLQTAHKRGKIVDGHGPQLEKERLQAFAASGIKTDHECTTASELHQKIASGMYVLLREGSASHDLRTLLKGVTAANSRRCLFCTDDRLPHSILEEGHIDNHLRIAVEMGFDPIEALRMATLNAAECYALADRGAIGPGKRADLDLVEDLHSFSVLEVWTQGVRYQDQPIETEESIPAAVQGKVNILALGSDDLKIHLRSPKVRVMEIVPGSLITLSTPIVVDVDQNGIYRSDSTSLLSKLAVIERHHSTGNVGLGLLKGYNITNGAIALTIAHDSHNLIVAGDNDEDMLVAIKEITLLGGGIVLVHNKKVLGSLALPIGGLMSPLSAEVVSQQLAALHQKALDVLHINKEIDPIMTLSFMALPVIGDVKLTDMGLFDINQQRFVPLEWDR